MSVEGITTDARERMKKAVAVTQHEFASLRTGKATAAILDSVRVEYYGNEVPLDQTASISVPEPRLIMVQPWEKQMVGEIAKAIQKAELGFNPIVDGVVIRIPIPSLNEERRLEMVKMAKKLAEDGRIAIRNIRRDANDHLKKSQKAKEISEDEQHRSNDDIQSLTDNTIAEIDRLVTAKETEIMEI